MSGFFFLADTDWDRTTRSDWLAWEAQREPMEGAVPAL